MWEYAIVALLVAGCTAYLLKKYVWRGKRKTGCGSGCGKCGGCG